MMKEIDTIIFDWIGTLSQFGGKGLFPDSIEVLEDLSKKYKLIALSRALKGNLNKRNDQINKIKNYFKLIIVDTHKDKNQFLEAINKVGSKPEKTLIVGDLATLEIKIGNELGCKTAWICKGLYSDEKPNKKTGNPTYKINSVKDLLKILK